MAAPYVKKNAVIDSTMLGFEDHGIFTFIVGLNYGDSSHQGAGTICLGNSKSISPVAGDIIAAILRVVGVTEWERLKGRSVIALFDDGEEAWGMVRGLQSFIGDRRVIWSEFFPSDTSETKVDGGIQ